MAVRIDGEGREWVSADAMDRVVAERDAVEAQHDALYLAVKEEVERLRRDAPGERTRPQVHGQGVSNADRDEKHADRLQAILDAAREKREVPDYGELVEAASALTASASLGGDGHAHISAARLTQLRIALGRLSSEQKGGGS